MELVMKKILLTLSLLVTLTALTLAQTNVDPGDGTLSAAINAASSGDVLVLESGGVYTESADSAYFIDKVLTIQAEEGAEVKPLLENHTVASGTDGRADLFMMQEGAGLTLIGLDLNGLEPDTNTYRSLDNIVDFEMGENYTALHLKFIDCTMRNVTDRIADGASSDFEGANVVLDTLVVDNCVVSNCENGFNFKYIGLNHVQAENSTFHQVLNGRAFRIMNTDPTVVMDHLTFDNIGVDDRWIDSKNNTAPWTIKNCIFSNSVGESEIIRIYGASSIIHHCDFFNVGADYLGLKDDAVEENNMEVDPMYTDAANGDYTLGNGSPCLGMGDDGHAVGDLRWDPNVTGVEVLNNEVPVNYNLSQNYPNPFNPSTTIRFEIPESGFTTLRVYNIIGGEITTLVNETINAGAYTVSFDATNLPSGVYFYRLTSGNFTQVNKMILTK
jgi:hypothetical protein